MSIYGERIRTLRTERGLSKLALCGDESQLTVRQLRRIENEGAKPTVDKLNFIAAQLGLSTYQLMPDYVDLPKDYLELKYLVLRTPTYQDKTVAEQLETYLDKIYECYYDDLPEEEKLAIDIKTSNINMHMTENPNFQIDVYDDYFNQVLLRTRYSLNDLLFITSFIMKVGLRIPELSEEERKTFHHIKELLLEQGNFIDLKDTFLLRDVLIIFADVAYTLEDYDYLQRVTVFLKSLMKKTQDFQKKPIVNIFEWRSYLIQKDYDRAEQTYQEALNFAELLNIDILSNRLTKTWEQDCEKFR